MKHVEHSADTSFRDRHPLQFNPDRLALSRGAAGLRIVAVSMLSFGVLFALVRRNASASSDAAITLRLQRQEHPLFDRLMRIVSWPGFPPQSRIIPPAISGVLWLLGFRLEGVFQLMAWGTSGVSFLFKRIMRRARPGPAFPAIRVVAANIGGTSFPSGHVLNYMGVYGFLTYLTFTWIRPALLRRVVVGITTGLIALVGPSRVYLGHHWFTDVMASYCLGTTYLVGITGLYRKVRMRLTR